MDYRLGEYRGMRAVKKGMGLMFKVFFGKTRGAILSGIRGIGVSVPKVEVRRDVADGLDLESKKCKLVVELG